MATVGDQLTAPEAGWQRFNDTDSRIVYNGKFSTMTDISGHWNSDNTGGQGSVNLKFKGTKIRLIDHRHPNRCSTLIAKIDGVSYDFSEYGTDQQLQTIVFEKLGLEDKFHTVQFSPRANSSGEFVIDAIDIDENGELLPYDSTPEEPEDPEQALLRVTMIDSSEREYKLPKADIDGFVNWFNRTVGTGTTVYVLNKMTGSKDYLAFDKIISFEVTPA